MKISNRLAGILLLSACLLQPAVSSAVTLGQIDNFQDGTTQNWVVGFTTAPSQPVNAVGGPAGPDDHYLLLTADGLPGAGGRLVVINQTQWAGNYPAAGVNLITMWVNNLGATDLSLRLYVADGTIQQPFNAAVSTVPVFLPAGSGWTPVHFSLSPRDLTAIAGNVVTALTNARELRIIHNPNPTFPPPRVAAQLGIDNIKATRVVVPPFLSLLLLDD